VRCCGAPGVARRPVAGVRVADPSTGVPQTQLDTLTARFLLSIGQQLSRSRTALRLDLALGHAMSAPSHWELLMFATPLSATNIAIDVGEHFVNLGIARVIRTRDVATVLAGFGLAFQLIKLLGGPVVEMRPVGLVKVRSRQSRYAALIVIALIALFLFRSLFDAQSALAPSCLVGGGASVRRD